MNRTDAPSKQAKPFGINGQREPLLPTTPTGDNTASYDLGFPPITMILKSAGGLPPKGQDMNQILFELSSLCRWMSTGAVNSFDQDFCTSIGGYPKASILCSDDGFNFYVSTSDGNLNNPNVDLNGWINLKKLISIASLQGGANKLPYFNGADTFAQTDFTSVGMDIVGKGTVSDILSYLGLGTAAQKNVGTGSGQIPDMSSFAMGTGYQKLPSGKILLWGIIAPGAGDVVTPLPIPLPNRLLSLTAITGYTPGGGGADIGYIGASGNAARIISRCSSSHLGCTYIAIGE